MLVKWIVCHVTSKAKSQFSSAQEHWGDLRHVKGFLGQIGGWNLHNTYQAGIVSFWRDQQSYQLFMINKHDDIFSKNRQQTTYQSIAVKLYEENTTTQEELNDYLSQAAMIRVLECPSGENPYCYQDQIVESALEGRSDRIFAGNQLGGLEVTFSTNTNHFLIGGHLLNVTEADDYVIDLENSWTLRK